MRDGGKDQKKKGKGTSIVPFRPKSSSYGPINETDVGNSIRFALDHREKARYVRGLGWTVWDGRVWEEGDIGGAHRLARETIRNLIREANDLADQRKRNELLRWGLDSENHHRIGAMVAQAQSQNGIAADAREFDSHPMLLNVANGIVDLETGKLSAHDHEKKITRLSRVEYHQQSKAPLWRRFLHKAFKRDEDLIEFVQRAVGYSLTGSTREDAVFILYGATGNNGKTTFLETVAHCLGTYADTTDPQTFMRRDKGSRNSPELAKLRGVRLVASYESAKGAMFDEARLKAISGGDAIEATAKYQKPIVYVPQFKVWFRTNHLPVVDANDEGIWRRLCVIPFLHRFDGENLDKSMRERLPAEEGPGILRWAVEGAQLWLKNGLKPPTGVRLATKSYRAEQEDSVGAWIKECTFEVAAAKQQKPVYGLFKFYRNWCDEHGHSLMDAKKFSQTLLERGYTRTMKYGKEGVGYYGIELHKPE